MSAKDHQDLITVTDAGTKQAAVIQNLLQLYTHDFSEFWRGTVRGELNIQGLFESYPLNDYGSRAGRFAHLIWCNDALAGFSLVNDHMHSGLAANQNMAEFFIVRKHRGRGVGRIAAMAIFDRHPGLWEVAVARKNIRAQVFWRNLIGSASAASEIAELNLRNADWDGPILRFYWGSQPSG